MLYLNTSTIHCSFLCPGGIVLRYILQFTNYCVTYVLIVFFLDCYLLAPSQNRVFFMKKPYIYKCILYWCELCGQYSHSVDKVDIKGFLCKTLQPHADLYFCSFTVPSAEQVPVTYPVPSSTQLRVQVSKYSRIKNVTLLIII